MRLIARHLGRITALVLLSGLACACLVRVAPGTFVDERELDWRSSEDTLAALRRHKQQQRNIAANFVHYLRGLATGDLGYSESNHSPISALLVDRAPRTLRDLSFGLAAAWIAGLGCAVAVARFSGAWIADITLVSAAGFLLSLPAALLAYFCLVEGQTARLVLVFVLAPKIFQYARGILRSIYAEPHVEMARARGVHESTVLLRHILPASAPQLAALAATTVSIAIGAAIPIEAICDVPGLGRLAWQAATARDLPLLIGLTMLVTLATTAAMAVSEFFETRGAA